MTAIENKVVAIKFDNAGFASKIKDTISALDGLKNKLTFSSSTKGLQDLESTVGKFNMSPMRTAIDGTSTKFLALATIGITALSRITDKAMSAGTQIIKSLTISPINDGLEEYETNMNSIQTILSNTDSKGSTLEDVNVALEKLNLYSDQTIYNFGQMAKNIGTFTAAGVGLETSVSSIKGIANLAAISGSNSEQASTAMYQLSQAIATGSLKLMDWNSVVNAGMGGEVFQKALFESGKAMHTLSDVPMDMTFKEWTDAGNTFRGSLESGWLTGEVLTNTLQGFTGDLSEAQIMAMGYTKEQAAEMMRLGKIGKAAATEIKTVTQLLGTVKESIGSGWSQSFKLIMGDFEEAKGLFTSMGETIGGFVGETAKARNDILAGWKFFNGRDYLISAMMYAVHALTQAVAPVKLAFREIFPRKTGLELAEMTKGFAEFVSKLVPSQAVMENIRTVFKAFFTVIKFGIEVIKGVFKVLSSTAVAFKALKPALSGVGSLFGDLVSKFSSVATSGSGIADFFEKVAAGAAKAVGYVVGFLTKIIGYLPNVIDLLTRVGEEIRLFGAELVSYGPAVKEFFIDIGNKAKEAMDKVIAFVGKIRDFIGEFFSGGDDNKESGPSKKIAKTGESVSIFSKIIVGVSGIVKGFFDVLKRIGSSIIGVVKIIGNAIGEVIKAISDAMPAIGDALGGAKKGFTFDRFLDALKVALGGGALLMIRNFIKRIMDLDFGGAFIDKLKGIFDELTNTLKAMQTKIKSEAIMNIAKALAVLTISLVVLSLIDGDKLLKALAATAAGMSQLVAAMIVMDKASGTMSGPKLAAIGLGMIGLAAAVLILSFAVARFGSMEWEDLKQGLGTVMILLVGLSGAAALMSMNNKGMIKTGLAMIGLSVGLLILSYAMTGIAKLDLWETGQSLIGMGAALLILTKTLENMPDEKQALKKGLAITALVFALKIMADVIKEFSKISFGDMLYGLAGIGGALYILSKAFNSMPDDMPATALGLLLISGALYVIGEVIEKFGAMKLSALATGIGAMAITLGVLAGAAHVLQGAGGAAVVMVAMAGGLFVLMEVIERFGNMSIAELVTGLIAMAAAMLVVAVGAIGFAALAFLLQPLIPAMLALGAAMFLFGAAAAMFGFGAKMLIDAVMRLMDAGKKGMETLHDVIMMVIESIPDFLTALGKGLADMALEFLAQGPKLISAVQKILSALLTAINALIPQVVTVISTLIGELIAMFQERAPEFIEAGFTVLISFLQGLRDNIYQIVTLGAEILVSLIQGLTDNIFMITEAAVNLIIAFLTALSERAMDLATAGVTLLTKLIEGISNNMQMLVTAVTNLIISFITALGENYTQIIAAGVETLVKFISGMTDNLIKIVNAVGTLISEFVRAMGLQATKIAKAGTDALVDFIGGMTNNLIKITEAVGKLVVEFVREMGVQATEIAGAGTDALVEFLAAITDDTDRIAAAIVEFVSNMAEEFGKSVGPIADAVLQAFIDAINGVANAIRENTSNIHKALGNLADAIIGVITHGIRIDTSIIQAFKDLAKKAWDEISNFWSGLNPFKKIGFGKSFVSGFTEVIDKDQTGVKSTSDFAKKIITTVSTILTTDKGTEVAATELVKRTTNAATQAFNTDKGTETAAAAFVKRTVDVVTNKFQTIKGEESPANAFIKEFSSTIENAATSENPSAAVDDVGEEIKKKVPNFKAIGVDLGNAITNGIVKGIRDRIGQVVRAAVDSVQSALQAVKDFLGIQSPSKVFMGIGNQMVAGMAIAIDNDSVVETNSQKLARRVTEAFQDTLKNIPDSLDGMDEFSPTITPVLDLTKVQSQAGGLAKLMRIGNAIPAQSFAQAQEIAHTSEVARGDVDTPSAPSVTEVKYEQNIYAPSTLSTMDIYRGTRSQLQMTKEELGIK